MSAVSEALAALYEAQANTNRAIVELEALETADLLEPVAAPVAAEEPAAEEPPATEGAPAAPAHDPQAIVVPEATPGLEHAAEAPTEQLDTPAEGEPPTTEGL